jgi:hypothetical protein
MANIRRRDMEESMCDMASFTGSQLMVLPSFVDLRITDTTTETEHSFAAARRDVPPQKGLLM